MGTDLGLMALHNRIRQIFDFLIFSQKTLKFRFLPFFGPKNAHILAKNQKIKNLVNAIVEGRETKVCAHFWP